MIRVDVVVPSYNYAGFLPGCLESLFGQEGVDVRVLVIDDASSDDTPAVAERLLQRFPGLEYRRHQHNAGHIATYNEGLLSWAVAPYVLLISADDLLAPGALRRAAEQMERHQGIGMVCGMALLFESEQDIAAGPQAKSNTAARGPDIQILPTGELLLECVRGNPIATPTVLVRTDLQRAVGPYAPELPHTGDMEMWMRFAVRGKVAVTRFVQAYKRLHSRNMSRNFFALRDLRERFKAIEFAFARDSQAYVRHGLSEEYARRSMAQEAVWIAHAFFEAGELAAVQDCLQFALQLWPAIRKSALWHKTQIKLHLGPWLYKKLRSVANLLGHWSSHAGNPPDPRLGPRPGTLQGWWPDFQPGDVSGSRAS